MKVLVVSDSHGNNTNLRKAIANMGDYLDLLIHLGDSEGNFESIKSLVSCPVYAVRGNCDSSSELPGAQLVDIGPYRAFITHGNRYGCTTSLELMREIARENGAQIVMYGHTHIPLIDCSDDITVVNPGSISKPRQEGHRPTYLVMTIEEDKRVEYSIVSM